MDTKLYENITSYELHLMIKKNWTFLKYVNDDKQSEELCMEAIKQNPNALQYIKYQTNKMCQEAVRINPHSLSLVTYKTPSLCMEAIIQDPTCIQYVPSYMQTHDICMEALKKDGMVLKYIENQTLQYCAQSLKTSNGQSFTMIKDRTKEICKIALQIDGLLLIHIEDHNYDLYLEAIKNNPMAIRYVNFNILKQDEINELLTIGIKQNPLILKYIDRKYHYKNICLLALKTDKNSINYIKNDEIDISSIEELQSSIVINKSETCIIKTNVTNNTSKIINLNDNITLSNYVDNYLKKKTTENYIINKINDNKIELYKKTYEDKYYLYFYKYNNETITKIMVFELYNTTKGIIL
ncbi:hypothetical protein Hokovirus_2_179 [Hokovirus HKV1]|uniref:DUF4116 domain-containing protein n=1 Tax=Hokovirus HKV1 TaxID=1977638 RepID=A0A1V0SG08_9VIRU|nr:hypothetical protein Hokovirus_2_179 [Hokovirus HKV1]